MSEYPIGRDNAIPRLVPNVPTVALCSCQHGVSRHRLSNERLTRTGSRVWDREECSDCPCQHYQHKEFAKL